MRSGWRYVRRGKLDDELDWFADKHELLGMHDDAVEMIEKCVDYFERVDLTHEADALHRDVLRNIERNRYGEALRNLENFVLSEQALFELIGHVAARAEIPLNYLESVADEYKLR